VQWPYQLEDQRGRIADLLEEIGVRADRAVETDLEGESVPFSGGKLARDVTIGDQDIVGDKPAGAHPVEARSLQIDAADSAYGAVKKRLGFLQTVRPDRAVFPIGKSENSFVLENLQDGARSPEDDAFHGHVQRGRIPQ
jgi:hypothetical protein